MADSPKIGGRFEFHHSTQTLEVWFTSGTHYILGPEANFDKALRGEVPIKLTGGSAARTSSLTWSEQLAGKMESEATRLISAAKVNRYSPKGRLEISLKDLDLSSMLAGLALPGASPDPSRAEGPSSNLKDSSNAVHESSTSSGNSESVSDPTDPGAE